MISSGKLDIERLRQGCEAEQLHLSGAIQAYGALLQVDAATHRITHASTNFADFSGVQAADLLGQKMDATPWSALHNFDRLPAQAGKTLAVPHVFENALGWVDALMIRAQENILIEFEHNDVPVESALTQGYLRALMSAPYDEAELVQHHKNLLQGLRQITHFDRILVYAFHEDWTGEVVEELAVDGMGSYLGLRFPASDIPEIARNLYLLNPSRMITDVMAAPVPILGVSKDPPDLTWSGLRSVSPVHLQYQKNMGVGASFSLPIRVNRKLWGLVACHHRTHKVLTPNQRNLCTGLNLAHSLSLGSYMASRRLQMLDSLDRKVERVMESFALHANPLDAVEAHAQMLMDSLVAQGFAMAIKTEVVIVGHGPTMEELAMVDTWFQDECRDLVVAVDCMADLFVGHLDPLSNVSGMMAVKARSQRSGLVRFYWFRPAELHEVAWAGNPNKPVVENAGALALSPRRSFERWIEKRTDRCRPWDKEEKTIASKFRSHLMRWL